MRHPLVTITATFSIWAGAFFILYATQATGCHLGWQHGSAALALRPALIALAAISIATVIVAALILRQSMENRSETDRFLRTICSYVSIAALCATIFCFTGVLWLSIC